MRLASKRIPCFRFASGRPHGDSHSMTSPYVRNRALRDAVVDGRAVHAQRAGDLPHSQWNSATDLDFGVPYQGRTKPAAKVSERDGSRPKRGSLVWSLSKRLRTLASSCSPRNMDCHAGGQGFESPTPRHSRTPRSRTVPGGLVFSTVRRPAAS